MSTSSVSSATSSAASTASTGSTASSATTTSASSTTDSLSEADVVSAAYAAFLEPADQLDTKISANEAKIAAYQDMQTLLQSLEDSLSTLHDSTTTSDNAFAKRVAELSTSSTSSTAELSASIAAGTATGTHQLVIKQIATAERVASSDVSDRTATLGYSGTFSIGEAGGTTAAITVSSGMSLNDVETAINDQSSTTGVNASVIEVSSSQYMLVLTASDTNKAIDLTSVSGTNVPESLGLVNSSGTFSVVLTTAQPAILNVDGVTNIQRDSNDISDIIDGVTLNLTSADPSATVTMKITNDTSSVESAIDSFVTAYNSWRAFVETNQATASDGTANTSAVLFSDSMLRSANQEIENSLGSLVDSNSLGAFGITFNEKDELVIDSTTLEEALQNNFTAVQSLFSFEATVSNSDLVLTSHSGSSYSGSFALSITTNGSGTITGAAVSGDSSLFTVSGDTITGNSGTPYAGLTFYYSGEASTSVNISLSQGIGDQVYQTADSYANTISGELTTEISSLESYDTDMQSEVNDIESEAASYKTFLLDQYGTLEAQIATANQTTTLLQTLLNYNASTSG